MGNTPEVPVYDAFANAPQISAGGSEKAIVESFKGLDELTMQALDAVAGAISKSVMAVGGAVMNGAANVANAASSVTSSFTANLTPSAPSVESVPERGGHGLARSQSIEAPAMSTQQHVSEISLGQLSAPSTPNLVGPSQGMSRGLS